ncbi:TPA: DNA-binding domain-containing protein [Salmonella enterica subsp. enterica serovar 40:-:1,5]|nr:DNA-binding domain-containing protein [Salmonella enterica]
MALMEFSTSESQVTEAENIPQPGALVVVKAGEETSRIADKKDKQKNCGEQFWRWLSDGVRSGSLSVNAPDSLVHITGGMIFIPTPEIFLPFLKKHHAAPLLSTEKTFSGNSKNWVVISAKGISHYFSA